MDITGGCFMTKYTDNDNLNSIISAFESLKQTDAVVLGGSRSTGTNDQNSDYDIYVYLNSELDNETKRKTVMPFCSTAEIGNHYWELEDNCIMKNGVGLDIIYRNTDVFSKYLKLLPLICHHHRIFY